MSVSDKTRKALEKIGLTSYEIRTYSSLLKTGPISASDLSQKSGVPYSKVYEVLGSLEEKGWIGSDDSRPTQYFAKSPSAAIQTTRQKQEETFKQNESVILNELTPLYEKSGTSERPDIWVVSGVVNIASKILEMVDSCRNEVLIAIPKVAEELATSALPKLRQLHDKGIDVNILVSDDVPQNILRSLARIANVKVKKNLFGGGIISDRRYVVILLGEEISGGGSGVSSSSPPIAEVNNNKKEDGYNAKSSGSKKSKKSKAGSTKTMAEQDEPKDTANEAKKTEAVAIWADHAGLAGFAREYFEYLLQDSKDANIK